MSPVCGLCWNGTPRAKLPGKRPGIKGVQELAVVEAVDAELAGVLVVERPADIVVAAHVVHPGAAVGSIAKRCCSDWCSSATSRVASDSQSSAISSGL